MSVVLSYWQVSVKKETLDLHSSKCKHKLILKLNFLYLAITSTIRRLIILSPPKAQEIQFSNSN